MARKENFLNQVNGSVIDVDTQDTLQKKTNVQQKENCVTNVVAETILQRNAVPSSQTIQEKHIQSRTATTSQVITKETKNQAL